MISDELSNAFFGFSLRRPGAELEGGGGVPPHAVENPDRRAQVKHVAAK